jgi:hypothetical protein
LISGSFTPDLRVDDSSAGANVSVGKGDSAGVGARLRGWYGCDADVFRFLDVIVGALWEELDFSRIGAGSESRIQLRCSSKGIMGDMGDLVQSVGDFGEAPVEDLASMSESGEEIERDVSNEVSASIPLRFRMAQFRGGLGAWAARSRIRNKGESSCSCLSSDASDTPEESKEVALRFFAWKLGVIGLEISRSSFKACVGMFNGLVGRATNENLGFVPSMHVGLETIWSDWGVSVALAMVELLFLRDKVTVLT